MAKYAKTTKVPVERSKTEIERTLLRYGVEEFFYGTSPKRGAGLGFKHNGRLIKFNIPLPDRKKFASSQAGETDWKREHRRLWRVLLLALKAKLELVDSGLTSFEDEFLAQTCLPTGETMSEHFQPKLNKMIETGKMPDMPKLLSG